MSQARSIGVHREGTTTLGSDTVSRDNFFSMKRLMTVQRVEQNRIPKVGSMDSSQRTALKVSSFANLRTQFATVNYNDVKNAKRRTRNAGAVPPAKKGAIIYNRKVPLTSQSRLYSKNNLTSNGFPVGEQVDKDMRNRDYTNEYDPLDYPDYFPGMAPFTDENIVVGDKSDEDRLIASQWRDWDDDVFDDWGFFYLYDVEQGKYYFPLISPQNQDDGELYVQIFNAFGRTFTIIHGYPVQGIFKFDISVNDDKPFKFGGYGDMGSDGSEVNTFLTYPYSIGSTNLTLYYVKQEEDGDDVEIVYTYCIPKKVSENNSQTYNLYQESGEEDNSWMSKIVTNGLIVYFSKTNDVKEWVINDLGIQ